MLYGISAGSAVTSPRPSAPCIKKAISCGQSTDFSAQDLACLYSDLLQYRLLCQRMISKLNQAIAINSASDKITDARAQ